MLDLDVSLRVEVLDLVFNQWLLVRRRELGLTQEDLAKRLGVSRQTVNNWETGRVSPKFSIDEWKAFCDVLQVSPSEIPGTGTRGDRQ